MRWKNSETRFVMPPEWALHEATWQGLPGNPSDWPGKFAAALEAQIEITRLLAIYGEEIHMIAKSEAARDKMQLRLEKANVPLEQLKIFLCDYDRNWFRDIGFTVVESKNGKGRIALIWEFGAWGEKYPNCAKDAGVAVFMTQASGLKPVMPIHKNRRVALEGGMFDVDGEGRILVTEECLLALIQQRNTGFTRDDYEEIFAKYLGASETIWLAGGIEGDDTHGHVDGVARFVAPGHVVACLEFNKADGNYLPLMENFRRLQKLQRVGFTVTPLPMPSPVYYNGKRLPASYANFYIGNGVVLVPTFNDLKDQDALNILTQLFPSRKVIGIHARDLVWGFGTIHCLTQQQPL